MNRTILPFILICCLPIHFIRAQTKNPEKVYIEMEAEHGLIGGPHSIGADPEASGGQYTWKAPFPAVFVFNIPTSEDYVLWFYTFARDGNNDSYKMKLDTTVFLWNNFPHLAWKWHSYKSFDLDKGQHKLELHLRDKDSPLLDKMLFTTDNNFIPGTGTQKAGHTYLYIEGEDADFKDNMFTVIEEDGPFRRKYIKPSHGNMQYPFIIPEEGSYKILCRVKIKDYGSDSFFMRVGAREFNWNTLPQTSPPSWVWAEVGNKSNHPIEREYYKKGKFSIGFYGRESGAKLDKIIITNDLDFQPGN